MSVKELTKASEEQTHLTLLMQKRENRIPTTTVRPKYTGLRFRAEQFKEVLCSLQALISQKIQAIYIKFFPKSRVTPVLVSPCIIPGGSIRDINTITLIDHQDMFEKMCDLSRLALNNPSIEMRELVGKMYTCLGVIVTNYSLDAADFDFLVESVPESRSAFSWHHTPNLDTRREKLENLIHKLHHFKDVEDFANDFREHFAQYAADLETIGSALGYRAIGSSVKKDTETQPSENMQRLLADMNKGQYMIPHIGQTEFPHRRTDDASRYSVEYSKIKIPRGYQDEIEGGLPGKQMGSSSRLFTVNSYVAKALSHNIPMRAHVSGTAPLTLAGFQFILNEGRPRLNSNGAEIPLDESSLMQLGGLLCATYALGDFHSIAETAAGVIHFYQGYTTPLFSNTTVTRLEEVPAKTFYALSFGMLNSIISDRVVDKFNAKTQDLLDLYVE